MRTEDLRGRKRADTFDLKSLLQYRCGAHLTFNRQSFSANHSHVTSTIPPTSISPQQDAALAPSDCASE